MMIDNIVTPKSTEMTSEMRFDFKILPDTPPAPYNDMFFFLVLFAPIGKRRQSKKSNRTPPWFMDTRRDGIYK